MFSRVISLRHLCISLIYCSVLLMLSACGQSSVPTSSTPSSTQPTPAPTAALDEQGTPIVFPTKPPQRIVSLVPSTSEILGALQLSSKVVGVDYYTNYPASLAAIPRVSNESGNFNVEQIVALKPDLVLTYGGETKQYDVQLQQLNLHVVDLARSNFTQSLQEILLVGRLTFTEDTATKLVQQLQQQINQIKASVNGTTPPRVYLEVDDSTPGKPFVFGGTSFGDELIQDAQGSNIFHNNSSNGGYPQVTDESVLSANPDYIILTEDPKYGGNTDAVYKRPNWGAVGAVRAHRVYHINVDIIQRPGPRLVQGLRCVAQIIHPDKFTGPLPPYCSAAV
jgi:ABC-type Fe3+-hydroxamate transport system substrate-binding protein